MQWRGGPISWLARKAKFIPQSSCESEVFGIVMMLKECEFAEQVITFIAGSAEADCCNHRQQGSRGRG